MAQATTTGNARRRRPGVPDALPAPACPGCGHIRHVYPLPALVPQRRRSPYGRSWDIFPPQHNPNVSHYNPVYPEAARQVDHPVPRALRPPEAPLTRWQALDSRITRAIDPAFAGLTVFLFGWATRSDFARLAVALGLFGLLTALWLAIALATGRFARANAAERAAYARAMRRWGALFYCEDCGRAFRRDRHGHLRPDDVPGYLRRAGDDDTIIAQGGGDVSVPTGCGDR